MYWIFPAMRRTVSLAEVFVSLSVPVSFAGETTRPEPFSTRSVTFISVTSPVTIPAFTFTEAGVTVEVVSPTPGPAPDGPGEQPRVIPATTTAKIVTPVHFDIGVSLPER